MMRLLFTFCALFFLQFSIAQKDSVYSTRLIIMHPTITVIEHYKTLVEKGLLTDTIEYIGVYSDQEVYDYEQVKEIIPTLPFRFKLIPVRGIITAAEVYKENSCSKMFDYLFKISDGMIFSGGPDLQPVLYGAETSLLTNITDPARHNFEISFLFHLLGSSRNPEFCPLLEKKPDFMILGICLGMQTMVVATGGTLVQDIPTEIYKKKTVEQIMKSGKQHTNYNANLNPLDETISYGILHPVKVDLTYSLWKACSLTDQVKLYSIHHQAAGKLSKIMKPVAWSADKKVIEAVVHVKYKNVLGIQFHPEQSALYDPQQKQFLVQGDKQPLARVIEHDAATNAFLHSFWKEMVGRLKN